MADGSRLSCPTPVSPAMGLSPGAARMARPKAVSKSNNDNVVMGDAPPPDGSRAIELARDRVGSEPTHMLLHDLEDDPSDIRTARERPFEQIPHSLRHRPIVGVHPVSLAPRATSHMDLHHPSEVDLPQ